MRHRRNSGDEVLRRLERQVLEGDEEAYWKLLREQKRRGVDDDLVNVRLLEKASDPVAFASGEDDVAVEVRRTIENKAESVLNAFANERAAERWSMGEEGEGYWEIAYFGDAVAINGMLVTDGFGEPVNRTEGAEMSFSPPEGFERDNRGGGVPGGSESEHEVEHLAREVMTRLGFARKDQYFFPDDVEEAVQKTIAEKFGHWGGRSREWTEVNYIPWSSSDGRTESYTRVELEACERCGVEGRYEDLSVVRAGQEHLLCEECLERFDNTHTCARCGTTGEDGFSEIQGEGILCDACTVDYETEVGESSDDEPEGDGD